ncbi:MAG: FecR domain-containing protein [bacterium]|nr:MAG: FecR domain-containing protein [bacterium]
MRQSHIIIVLLFFLFLSAAFAADPVAVILRDRGKVDIFRKDVVTSQDARKGMVLYDGDKIITGASSICMIKYTDDKSLLRIKANSSCVIEGTKEAEKVDKNIVVQFGTFFVDLFRPKGKFTVTTPTSVASVKGTKWWVIQESPTKYIVVEGMIDCENKAGKFLVKAGQTAIFTSDSEAPLIALTKEEEIPALEDEVGDRQSLEIEFKDADGKTKKMIIDYQKNEE